MVDIGAGIKGLIILAIVGTLVVVTIVAGLIWLVEVWI